MITREQLEVLKRQHGGLKTAYVSAIGQKGLASVEIDLEGRESINDIIDRLHREIRDMRMWYSPKSPDAKIPRLHGVGDVTVIISAEDDESVFECWKRPERDPLRHCKRYWRTDGWDIIQVYTDEADAVCDMINYGGGEVLDDEGYAYSYEDAILDM